MTEHLHQVYLMATDFQASARFYSDVVGLSALERTDSRAAFDTGSCSLVIEPDFDEETLAAFGMSPPGPNRGDGIVIVIEVADVDAVYDRAQAHDATVLQEPTDVSWGRRLLLLEDPDGYVLEISRPLDE